jgi:hypothetical protein
VACIIQIDGVPRCEPLGTRSKGGIGPRASRLALLSPVSLTRATRGPFDGLAILSLAHVLLARRSLGQCTSLTDIDFARQGRGVGRAGVGPTPYLIEGDHDILCEFYRHLRAGGGGGG